MGTTPSANAHPGFSADDCLQLHAPMPPSAAIQYIHLGTPNESAPEGVAAIAATSKMLTALCIRTEPMTSSQQEHYVRHIGEVFDRPPHSKRGFGRSMFRSEIALLMAPTRAYASASQGGQESDFFRALHRVAADPAKLKAATFGAIQVLDVGDDVEGIADLLPTHAADGGYPTTPHDALVDAVTAALSRSFLAADDAKPRPSLGAVSTKDGRSVFTAASIRALRWAKAQSQALVSVTYFGVAQAEFWSKVCFPRVRNAVLLLADRVHSSTKETLSLAHRILSTASARSATAAAASSAADGDATKADAADKAAPADDKAEGTGAADAGADTAPATEAERAAQEEAAVLLAAAVAFGRCGLLGSQQWIVNDAIRCFNEAVLATLAISEDTKAEVFAEVARTSEEHCCDREIDPAAMPAVVAELASLRRDGLTVSGALADPARAAALPRLCEVRELLPRLLAEPDGGPLEKVTKLLDTVMEERRMSAEAYADLMSACSNNKDQAAMVFERVMAWGKDLNGFPPNLAYNILISCARSHDELIAAINRMTELDAPMDQTVCDRVLRRYQGKPYSYYDLWALIQHNPDGFPDTLRNHKYLAHFAFKFGPTCTSKEIINKAIQEGMGGNATADDEVRPASRADKARR